MEKNNTDIYEILQSVVDQFDAVTKFNDGQVEINKLTLELFDKLEKRIKRLEERSDELEERLKECEKLATVG